MPHEFSRAERVAAAIQRGLAPLLRTVAADHGLGLLSIAAVDVSKDLRQAKVFVSQFGNDVEGLLDLPIKEIIDRRHRLIHSGSEPDQQSFNDLYRLQIILERWLLKLLKCPDEALSFRAYDTGLLKTLQSRN